MFQKETGTLIASFAVLFILSIYYIKKRTFIEQNFWLIIFSTFQGIIIGLLYQKEFLKMGLWALVYFTVFTKVVPVLTFSSVRKEEYSDDKILSEIKKIKEFESLQVEFKKFYSENSFNAMVRPPMPFIEKNFKIYLGNDLISKSSLEEKIAIIAHEISHVLNKDFIKKSILIIVTIAVLSLISIFSNVITLMMPFSSREKALLIYLIALLILLIGIIVINYISWYFEYKADNKASKLIGKSEWLIWAFRRFEKIHKERDYGKFINLILYTHPLIKHRIEELQKL